MYTSFRQQYTFGHDKVDISSANLTNGKTKYLGSATGLKDSAQACEPIDLKDDGQMYALKARLDFKILKTLKGTGATATIKFMTCGEGSNGNADTVNAIEILSIPLSAAVLTESSSQPFLELTMPSNCRRFVYLSITAGATAFSEGVVLIHFNPNK